MLESLETRIRLSMLWVFINLNTFAKDFHELARDGVIDQMRSGSFNGVEITEGMMLIGGLMFEATIIMVLLSLILPRRINRWVTGIGAGLSFAILASVNVDPDLDNLFFFAVQSIALVAIVWVVWRWPPKPQA